MKPDAFDPLLLSQVRLGIVSVLMTRREATFSDLRELLGVTQGNLGIHLQKLEDGEYIAVTRAFVGKRPRSTCRLTAKGRRALRDHVARLRQITGDEGA